MARILPSLATLLLCSTALAGCDTLGGASSGTPVSDKTALEKRVHENPPADVATGVRQAHDLRLAGNYDDATRILSQMMLVASDDPRVVGEYGKTLLQRGRSQDAVQFLNRAVQIDATDWSTYSALGVANDQLGDQRSAKDAYEHALALQPNEASVLSNYALSRMLANDLPAARVLAARAQKAGGDADPKIARNIAMIEATAPAQPVAMAPSPVAPTLASAAPAPEQKMVASAAPVHIVPATGVVPTGAPRVLMPASASNTLPAGTQPYSGVVMQAVPFDPPAGPVASAKPAPAQNAVKIAVKPEPVKHAAKHTPHAPEMVAKAVPADETVTAKSDSAKTDAAKPGADKIAASAPAKAVAAATPVKPVAGKASEPVKAAAVTTPVKAVAVNTPVKPVANKTSEPIKTVSVTPPVKFVALSTPVKPVTDKASEPVKAAAVTVPVKAVAAATPVKPGADKTPQPVKAAAVTTPVKAVAAATPVKPVTDKPAPVKVAAAAPVKGQAVADKTPAAVKVVAAKQDGVPALRLAADASTP